MPLAALAVALVLWTHTITSIALFLSLLVYAVFAFRERTLSWAIVRRGGSVLVTAGVVALPVVVPALLHRELLGPATGWGDFPFLPTLLRGHVLGTAPSNALAILFLLLAGKRSFEERFLAASAWVTFAFGLGLVATGVPTIDGTLSHLLEHRALPYLGLFLALLAGVACSRVGETLLRWLSRPAALRRPALGITTLLVLAPLGWSGHQRVQQFSQGSRVDSHYDNLEKRTYLDAYRWPDVRASSLDRGFRRPLPGLRRSRLQPGAEPPRPRNRSLQPPGQPDRGDARP
jgi:hypothetical protein